MAKNQNGSVEAQDDSEPDRRSVLLASLLAGAASIAATSSEVAPAFLDIKKLEKARRYLIRNAIILSVDPDVGGVKKADMLVENGKIMAIAPLLPVSAETLVVDGTNRILIPGFVDTHSHSYQGLLRGLLPNRKVLQFTTVNAARAAGLDHKIGSLTPGKEADFLMLRANNLSIWPLNNACVAAVNLMSAGHIEGVFVAGKVKKWQGRLLGIDRNIVLREAARLRDNVLQKAQFSIGLTA